MEDFSISAARDTKKKADFNGFHQTLMGLLLLTHSLGGLGPIGSDNLAPNHTQLASSMRLDASEGLKIGHPEIGLKTT